MSQANAQHGGSLDESPPPRRAPLTFACLTPERSGTQAEPVSRHPQWLAELQRAREGK
jgi:hypothetical protein